MLSLKRLLYIVLIVIVLGGIFLIYSINESHLTSVQIQSHIAPEWEFTKTRQVDEGQKPRVWILGNSEDAYYAEIYSNVRQFCRDLHFTIAEEGLLSIDSVKKQDLLIFCDAFISRYVDPAELERFIAEGGKVILTAGLAEEDGNSRLWSAVGIQEKSKGKNYHDLVFEKPLLPVQSKKAYYDGNSGSARIKVNADASVYIREAADGIPILYTYAYQKGSVCLINGNFLKDIRCMGLLSGAIGALLPDFVYPILGVKVVFLDNFSMVASADDDLCRRAYGYSAEGFVRDVVWPAFQGISLRTDTPYTSSVLAAASSEERFGDISEALFTSVGKWALQIGGELVYAADCSEDGKIVFNEDFIDRFSEIFSNYTIRGIVMETDKFLPEILNVPSADIRSVRGILGSRNLRLSWKDERFVFPSATAGNSMEDGNLFAAYSVLGAYGMVSHVFDVNKLIICDGDAAWDLGKKQISLFESEILTRVSWLKGRTLTQTEGDVKSYQDMDYGWTKSDNRMEINCSSIAKGQTFFYHTDGYIVDAEGLTYQDIGNGYYLLRVHKNRANIILKYS